MRARLGTAAHFCKVVEVVPPSSRCNSYVTNKMGDLECRREAEKSKVKSDLGGSANAERDGLRGGEKGDDLGDEVVP